MKRRSKKKQRRKGTKREDGDKWRENGKIGKIMQGKGIKERKSDNKIIFIMHDLYYYVLLCKY